MPAERPTHSSSGLWPGPSISSGALPVQAQAPAPAQTPAPYVSTRPQKPPKPARTVKLVSKSNWEDEEQFRQRVSGNWDVPMTSAGLKKGGKRKKQKQKGDLKKKSTKGNH